MPLHFIPLQEIGTDGETTDHPYGIIVATHDDAMCSDQIPLARLKDLSSYNLGRPLNRPEIVGHLGENQFRLVTLAPRERDTLRNEEPSNEEPSNEEPSSLFRGNDPEYSWSIQSPIFGDEPKMTARFRIDVFDIDESPIFDALSYTWVDYHRKTMVLNATTLKITGNLVTALRHLQHQYQPRVLWIDALCINQDDDKEKAQQVGMMKEIYSRADTVVVWLGESDGLTELAFSSLARRAEKEGLVPGVERLRYPLATETVQELNAAYALMNRPYFNRIWIVQEVVVARNAVVKCGVFELGFRALIAGARWYGLNCPTHYSDGESTFSMLSNGHRMIMDCLGLCQTAFRDGDGTNTLRLENLLLYTRNCKATNPLDRVYALLGIAREVDKCGVLIDYSLAPEELYSRVTRGILCESKDLNILSAVQRHREVPITLPSWVPDWRDPWKIEPLEGFSIFEHRHRRYNASGGQNAIFFKNDDSKKLVIGGYAIDFVVKFFNPLTGLSEKNMMSFWFGNSQMKKITDDQGLSGPYEYTQEPIEQAYLKTISVDLLLDSSRFDGREELIPLYWYVCTKWLRDGHELKDMYTEAMPLELRSEIFWHIMKYTTGRTVFVTDAGVIGLGPSSMVENDKIVVFPGASVPFAIRGERPCDAKLIGECYVHGFMDGKFMAAAEQMQGISKFELE